MTSRERILATLQHRQADRVPLAEMWIDPRVVKAIVPGATDANDLVAHLDLDMVTAPTMIYGPDEVEWVDRAKGVCRDKWGALQHLTQEAIPVPMLPARLETEEDLARYSPPDPAKSPVLDKVRRLRARFPDKAVAVVGESGWAPVGLSIGYVGFAADNKVNFMTYSSNPKSYAYLHHYLAAQIAFGAIGMLEPY